MSAKHRSPLNFVDSTNFVVSSFLLLFWMNLVGESSGLRLTSMNAPVVADPRDVMELNCHFDMGTEDLYAVKWYKDDQEFFRYMPSRKPNTMLFPVSGVQLISSETECNQSHCRLRLNDLSRLYSGGAYKCEISSEAPAFRLASETHNVTIAAFPRENPKIEGVPSSVSEGDIISVKCISDFADPEPILVWKVNGQDPSPNDVIEAFTLESEVAGLVSRSITLRLPIEGRLVRGSDIEIRCEAAQPGVPLPKQVTIQNVVIRNANDPLFINNEKLHWSTGSTYYHNILFSSRIVLLIWVEVIRRSIERLFK